MRPRSVCGTYTLSTGPSSGRSCPGSAGSLEGKRSGTGATHLIRTTLAVMDTFLHDFGA